jgi:hypothetical protein
MNTATATDVGSIHTCKNLYTILYNKYVYKASAIGTMSMVEGVGSGIFSDTVDSSVSTLKYLPNSVASVISYYNHFYQTLEHFGGFWECRSTRQQAGNKCLGGPNHLYN